MATMRNFVVIVSCIFNTGCVQNPYFHKTVFTKVKWMLRIIGYMTSLGMWPF